MVSLADLFTSIAFFRSGIASLVIDTEGTFDFAAFGSGFPFLAAGLSAPGVAGGVGSLAGTGIQGFIKA